MERTSVALLSDLLSDLFTQPDLDMYLASHATLSPARGAGAPAVASNLAIFLTAEALLKQGLVPDPLVPLLHKRFKFQTVKIDAFLCAFLVRETADQLARLGPNRLNDWSRYFAPTPLAERLNGKPNDDATIAAQLPALQQRDREAALSSLRALWPEHSAEAVALNQLIRRWAMVAKPVETPPPPPTPPPTKPNDLRHFVRTLDRMLVWRVLLDACQRSAHQLLVVRGDPSQSLSEFRDRVRRDLSNQSKPHTVRTFGPGQDHSVATTAAGWAELLCESIGHADLPLAAALWEDTQRKPALYIVGLNSPLHLGDGGLSEDEFDALMAFLAELPSQLPTLGAQSPVRLLLPVQVDAVLGENDPLFQRIVAAIEAAEANDPRGAVQAVSVGALLLPEFDEIREPLKERAKKRHGRALTEADWAQLRAAHGDAKSRHVPFKALAEAIWRALPPWMQEP